MFTTFEVFKRGVVWCNKTSLCSCFNAHVADRHAAFHRKGTYSGTAIFDDVANAAACSDFADDGKDDVFSGDAFWRIAFNSDGHPLRT